MTEPTEVFRTKPMISINSDTGRIGRIWWDNGVHSEIVLQNATYNGSTHYVWRPGIWGWDGVFTPEKFYWLFTRRHRRQEG